MGVVGAWEWDRADSRPEMRFVCVIISANQSFVKTCRYVLRSPNSIPFLSLPPSLRIPPQTRPFVT